VKIRRVVVNNRKSRLEVTTTTGKLLQFPFVKLSPKPTSEDHILVARPDRELANEAVTYTLESGSEGSVPLDAILEYNEDPRYVSELLLHQLTVEALKRIVTAGLSRREIARRLDTSLPQIYRLLDPTNTTKSLNQLVALLHVLGYQVAVVVKRRRAAA
jgi:hypothetical protein